MTVCVCVCDSRFIVYLCFSKRSSPAQSLLVASGGFSTDAQTPGRKANHKHTPVLRDAAPNLQDFFFAACDLSRHYTFNFIMGTFIKKHEVRETLRIKKGNQLLILLNVPQKYLYCTHLKCVLLILLCCIYCSFCQMSFSAGLRSWEETATDMKAVCMSVIKRETRLRLPPQRKKQKS